MNEAKNSLEYLFRPRYIRDKRGLKDERDGDGANSAGPSRANKQVARDSCS